MDRYIVIFKNKADKDLLTRVGAKNIKMMQAMNKIAICNLTSEMACELKENESIRSIEKDNVDEFNDTFDATNESYVIEMMDVKQFHNEGITGQGVKVAVLDTGIQKHEDLIIAGGFNAYDEGQPYDSNLASSHGTKVAGIVAAQDNDTLGVAPGVELYAVRIDDGNGSINRTLWSAQINAIDWCIANNMDAINCSFSSETESQARRLAFEEAYNAGIAIFCSAGNRQDGVSPDIPTIAYPSNYPFVVTVANIKSDKTRYPSSSVGRGVNFSSGGVSVRTTTIDANNAVSRKYANGTGTSYSCPAVMGMFALYKQKYGESRDKTLQRMYVNAENIGDSWEFGAGIPKFPSIDYKNIYINERSDI